jgi:hypothetical protein
VDVAAENRYGMATVTTVRPTTRLVAEVRPARWPIGQAGLTCGRPPREGPWTLAGIKYATL